MRRAWTVTDDAGEERTDIAVVVEETKEDALEALRKAMQDCDEYWTFVVIDGSIYKFAPGYGYKGDRWDCDDLRPDMWDTDAADGVFELAALPCYYIGEKFDTEDFFKYHDVLKTLTLRSFKKKFPNTLITDERISNVYLNDGTILLNEEWNGWHYDANGMFYYPVDVPISFDEDGEPDQYETVGYVAELS